MKSMTQEQQQAVVFDAFGTLFNVTALGDLMSEHIPDAESVAGVWRSTQLQYSFIRSMTRAYVDFDQVTREALDRALALHDINVPEETRQRLAGLWTALPLYDDARPTLESFQNHTRAILSNGTFQTIASLLETGGIEQNIDVIISADSAGRFKPDPMVYAMAQAALGVPARDIHFVSSNAFDVAGSKAAGFNVYWVNRTGLSFDHVGWEPDVTVNSLAELPDRVREISSR